MQVPTVNKALSNLRLVCGQDCRCADALEYYADWYAEDDEILGELAVMAMNLAGRVPPFFIQEITTVSSTSIIGDLRAVATPPFPSRLVPEAYGLHEEAVRA